MTDKLRAVLVGCGGMSRRWVKAVREVGDVELVGLADIQEESARKLAEQSGLTSAAVGTSLPKMLRKLKPDAVFDCTIPAAHFKVTMTALKAGCHVLGEKPMADSMAHARRMVEAAQRAGKLYAVIQNRRYDPNIRRVKALLASGALGQITTAHSDFFIGAHFGGFRDRMKHVLVLDMAIHTFDAARFLMGADAVGVYCREWNPAGSWYDHDASAVAIFELSNGGVYGYRGSWCSEGLNTTWESEWRLIGSKGSARWDGQAEVRTALATEPGGLLRKCVPVDVPACDPGGKVNGHTGLMREFVDCVRKGGTPETVCTDNIKSLAMVFAAIKSSETGRHVKIE